VQSAGGQALFWGVLPAWLGLAWLGLAWLGVPGRKTKAMLAWLKYLGLSFLKRLHLPAVLMRGPAAFSRF